MTRLALIACVLAGCAHKPEPHWPASPAEQFGLPDGEPMRCWDHEKRTVWAARKDGVCYEKDEPRYGR